MRILREKLHFLEMRCFLFRNLGADAIKNYTGIDKQVFEVIIDMIESKSSMRPGGRKSFSGSCGSGPQIHLKRH